MSRLPKWDEYDVEALLTPEAIAPGKWRTRYGDANNNGRSYGGQLLGQAMMAALMDVPRDRPPTMMQFLFLQGAMPDQPLDFTVTPLQDGKRFSSRHVRAVQAGRTVLDAQVTCALPLDAPAHADLSPAPLGEHPLDLPDLAGLDLALRRGLERLGGYSKNHKPSVEFRIPDAVRQLSAATATERFRYWMKARGPLPDNARIHAAAFAFFSDWWLNFSSLSMHLRDIGPRKLYISSLNHAIWLHHPVRADEWLHVEAVSPCAISGRGLSVARFHDLQGRFVASGTQECLMAYVD
ncbi:acyl-CoA thioesterase II [Variovorax sp. WS11]|nr:acyl-CoA thioesterase II [Variovorax sp. WS11]PSL80073.1 acyl-CoA thioesterase II [Variovorax sp. WS11]